MSRKLTQVLVIGFIFLLLPIGAFAGEEDGAYTTYSLWVGSHYTDFKDYRKKVGEYNLGANEVVPEYMFNYASQISNSFMAFDGHYYDNKNVSGKIKATVGDQVKGEFQYRSLIAQKGQDLLENLQAKKGAKMMTYEILDPDADYNTHLQQILGELEVLLSKKNNIRMVAAHRMTLQNGEEQKIASMHCFSCHMTSQTVEVDKRTHQFETGIEADAGDFDFGYLFGYRLFESKADEAMIHYDSARHPTDTFNVAEFPTRVIYDDTTINYGIYPKTEKISHKVRVKGDIGKGLFAGIINYNQTKNKRADLTYNTWTASANYALPLGARTRLVAKVYGAKINADEVFIDLPAHREGRPTGPVTSFDYNRYSTLDRTQQKVTAEVISRIKPRITLSLLAGFNRIDRDHYPAAGDERVTKQFTGQFKARYRKGLKYTAAMKYRFEKTADPFTSAHGLFESKGRGTLEPIITGSDTASWIMYFQREDIRYQKITTLPTDRHEFEWKSTYRPSQKYSLSMGLKGSFDKNNDLDSLDVKHSSLQPNLTLNVTPDARWLISAVYTYNYDKSRGPIAVALFDG